MDDINKFMNKVSFRNKNGYSNYNSFIVNFPRDEYLVDIAEMGYLKGSYSYLFLCIDIFFQNLLMELKCQIKIQTLQHLY